MARDRLLAGWLAATHPHFGTPSRIAIIIGVLVAILAGVTPIATAAELVNIGTLFAFMLVAAGVLLLRRGEPDPAASVRQARHAGRAGPDRALGGARRHARAAGGGLVRR